MDRLKEWSDTIIKEPAKPEGDIDKLIASNYDTISKLEIEQVEKCIFILESFMFYISYKCGMTESYVRYHEAKGDTAGLVKERIKLATFIELKYALKNKMDVFKMIYFRKRGTKKYDAE